MVTLPFFLPYLSPLDAGFRRSLADARIFSGGGWGYLASPVLAHRWMLPLLGVWKEVLFPGFHALILSALAVVLAWRLQTQATSRIVGFYVLMMALAFWFSLGPDAGLYTLGYHVFPLLAFLRAPVRMGVMVTLGSAVLASLALTWWQPQRARSRRIVMTAVLMIAVAESWAGPLQLAGAPPVDNVYRRLVRMPRAPVAEFPFYYSAEERHLQTDYMLMSTFHWQPLLNGYSDYIPSDYFDAKAALVTFPSPQAMDALRDRGIRWVVVHFNRYGAEYAPQLRRELRTLDTQLRVVINDTEIGLYEVIFPMRPAVVQPR